MRELTTLSHVLVKSTTAPNAVQFVCYYPFAFSAVCSAEQSRVSHSGRLQATAQRSTAHEHLRYSTSWQAQTL